MRKGGRKDRRNGSDKTNDTVRVYTAGRRKIDVEISTTDDSESREGQRVSTTNTTDGPIHHELQEADGRFRARILKRREEHTTGEDGARRGNERCLELRKGRSAQGDGGLAGTSMDTYVGILSRSTDGKHFVDERERPLRSAIESCRASADASSYEVDFQDSPELSDIPPTRTRARGTLTSSVVPLLKPNTSAAPFLQRNPALVRHEVTSGILSHSPSVVVCLVCQR